MQVVTFGDVVPSTQHQANLVDKYIDEAEAAIDAGDFAKAIEMLEKANPEAEKILSAGLKPMVLKEINDLLVKARAALAAKDLPVETKVAGRTKVVVGIGIAAVVVGGILWLMRRNQ